MIYGYARISRSTQSIDRQIRNILKVYPNAVIYQEAFTGTKITGRRQFERLLKKVQPGDTILFDSVSRMSRNAEEGIKTYFELYHREVELIFLKEQYINTATFKNAVQNPISMTGTSADKILKAVNEYLVTLAEEQIRIAFEQAQKEVDDLHERTKEGLETARRNGKQIGQKQGTTLKIKKKEPLKAEILKKSQSFNGSMIDKDLMKVLGIARNTYYKYKRELMLEQAD